MVEKERKIIITQPLQTCICSTIRVGRESWCLPYAGFYFFFVENNSGTLEISSSVEYNSGGTLENISSVENVSGGKLEN